MSQLNWIKSAWGWVSAIPHHFTAPASRSLTTERLSSSLPFPDVDSSHWAHDYIQTLANQRIISGFPDGSFRPDAPVTRAQFAAILRNAFPAEVDIRNVKPFSDVSPSYWANAAIRTARATGFLSGYPGNRFRPEQNIPRIQALVSLTNGLDYPSNRLTATDDRTILNYYQDADQIPDYAIASLAAATDVSLVVNYPNPRQLNPNRNASRAEITAFMYQALYQEATAPPLLLNPYRIVATSQPWQTQPSFTASVRASQLSFNGPGTRLMTLDTATNLLQIWDVEAKALLRSLNAPSGTTFEAIALSEDGEMAIALHQNQSTLTLQAWSVQTGQSLWQQSFNLPSGNLANASQRSQVLTLSLTIRPRHNEVLTQISLAPSLTEPPNYSQLQLHQLDTGAVSQSLETRADVALFQFAFSFHGDDLAALGTSRNAQTTSNNQPNSSQLSSQQQLQLWSISNGSQLSSLPLDSNTSPNFFTLAFTPNGSLRALGQNLNEIQLDTWDIRSGQRLDRITQLPGSDRQDSLGRLSPDGIWYFVHSDVVGTRLINTQLGAVIPLETAASQVIFNGKGDRVAVVDQANVKVFSQIIPE